MPSEYFVDFRSPPAERWTLDAVQSGQAACLLENYLRDLGMDESMHAEIAALALEQLPAEYREEMHGIAERLGAPLAAIVIGNCYYDLAVTLIGCTGFAVATENGPLHARNLDWWTENRLLGEATMVTRFTGAPAGDFVAIGWPGYIGMLSGVAPGRFAISLNAVSSDEPRQIALPVALRIRHVFEEARSFAEAVTHLSEIALPCDCLLLVSGIENNEMAVIERTPTRHAIRRAEAGRVIVTNDYRTLATDAHSPETSLQQTSCGRYDRIQSRLGTPPATLTDCLGLLADPQVQMQITVQQMAFHAGSGRYRWRIPA